MPQTSVVDLAWAIDFTHRLFLIASENCLNKKQKKKYKNEFVEHCNPTDFIEGSRMWGVCYSLFDEGAGNILWDLVDRIFILPPLCISYQIWQNIYLSSCHDV